LLIIAKKTLLVNEKIKLLKKGVLFFRENYYLSLHPWSVQVVMANNHEANQISFI